MRTSLFDLAELGTCLLILEPRFVLFGLCGVLDCLRLKFLNFFASLGELYSTKSSIFGLLTKRISSSLFSLSYSNFISVFTTVSFLSSLISHTVGCFYIISCAVSNDSFSICISYGNTLTTELSVLDAGFFPSNTVPPYGLSGITSANYTGCFLGGFSCTLDDSAESVIGVCCRNLGDIWPSPVFLAFSLY